MTWLESWISPEQRAQTLFVADSSWVTNENLEHLAQADYRFVSRLPESYALAQTARAEALDGPADRWVDIGRPAAGKKT